MTILITGGLGFIGSHLIDALMTDQSEICVFDNLSSGTLENIKQLLRSPNLTLIKGDLQKPAELTRLRHHSYETIYHLAADPEVRVGSTTPNIHFQQNVVATRNLLEYLRKTSSTPSLVFTSTSTVYGEATKIPTPEDYGPQMPISAYGASKLASEALISAYAHNYNFKALIFRLANIIGSRSQHGVIYDFAQKLKKNPKELEILGDGTQTKSYLHISDCIEAMQLALAKSSKQVEIYNIGSEDQINVMDIAQIVIEEMKLKNVKLKLTGGVDGGRGWKGDIKNMLLDVTKLKSLGWKPKLNSKQAIKETAKHLVTELLSHDLKPIPSPTTLSSLSG